MNWKVLAVVLGVATLHSGAPARAAEKLKGALASDQQRVGEGETLPPPDAEMMPPPPETNADGTFIQPPPPGPLEPNELGQIMILEYHIIDKTEGRWTRTPENFRQDLRDLWERGYVLANLNDVLDGNITAPAGKTPVVLTFDDSAKGQFAMIDGQWNPDTAVGMIDRFYQEHPDFGRAGTFYVNPDKRRSQAWSPMLKQMVSMGFELGNHTVTHPKLSDLTHEKVESEIAGCHAWIEANVPGYKVRTIALPFGIYPKENGQKREAWAEEGESRGARYKYDALLEVGSNPMPSPFSNRVNRLHIPRVQVWGLAGPNEPVFSYFLKGFDRNPSLRFVSDGNPEKITYPRARASQLDRSKWTRLQAEER